jgi:hypothetical protein
MIAGCSGSTDSSEMASDGVPGVEDGEIVDHHTFANAHSDQLATRTGTLEKTRVWLDRETGDAERYSVSTVQVDGDRVAAVVSGRTHFMTPNTDRLEVYFGDDSTIFLRTRTDGEWTTMSGKPREMGPEKGRFTGTSVLEAVSMTEVGTETVDGEELHRFSNAGRSGEDGTVEWVSIQALVDEDALVHSFHQTLAGTTKNQHKAEEWHLTDLGSTTVNTPDWVVEADA